MPYGTNPGIELPFASENANVIPWEVFRLAINWLPNRCPLLARLPKGPLNSLSFYMNSDNFRPRNPIARHHASESASETRSPACTHAWASSPPFTTASEQESARWSTPRSMSRCST